MCQERRKICRAYGERRNVKFQSAEERRYTKTGDLEGSFYPGPLPIGIVAGIVLLIQIALLILCIRNILTFRFQWIIALTMLMSGFSILGTGFFFIGWFLVFIA